MPPERLGTRRARVARWLVRVSRPFRPLERAGSGWAERRPKATAIDAAGSSGSGAPVVRLPTYVVHWDAPEWCSATVRSLLASEGVEIDLVVIDNSSTPGLAQVLPERAHVRVNDVNCGYTGAANQGLRDWLGNTTLPYCLITSHDARVGRRTLRSMIEVMDAHPSVGIVGPAGGDRFPTDPAPDGPAAVEARPYVTGSTLLVRRACAEAVGEFDESFRSYVEDVDYCYRAWDAGWQVAALTGVRVGMNGSRSPASWALTRTNRVLLAKKRRGSVGALVRLALLSSSSLSYTVSGLVRRGRSGVSARTRARQERTAVAEAVRRLWLS